MLPCGYLPALQVQRLVVVVHHAALDDHGADQLLVAPQLVDQVLPPAAGTGSARLQFKRDKELVIVLQNSEIEIL